jgi:RNA polymerase sigma factor (sigma-70 family)
MGEGDFLGVLNAARRGSEEAWIALYRDLAPRVIGYLRGQGAPDPEDLAGEVFVDVVRALHRFEGDEHHFRSWVLSITHNRLVDARRRWMRRPFDPLPPEVIALHGAAGDTEDDALGALGYEEVLRMLGDLSPDRRDVILLRTVGDLSIEQVATILNKRPGTIRVLHHRAIAQLRRKLPRKV